METINAKALKQFAAEVYETGYAGGASCRVKYVKTLSAEKIAEIKSMFKPLIEAKLAEYAKMPKNEFNKKFVCDFLEVGVKIDDADMYKTTLSVDTYAQLYSVRHVRGREIKSLRSIDEILENLEISSTDYSNRDAHMYKCIEKDEAGNWMFVKYSKISQAPIEITRKNWGRGKMCKQFQELVCSEVKKIADSGWEFVEAAYVEAAYVGNYVKMPVITFKKAA